MPRHDPLRQRVYQTLLWYTWLLTVICLLLTSGCTSVGPPTHKVVAGKEPFLFDDGDTNTLIAAGRRQLDYLHTLPADRQIMLGRRSFTIVQCRDSLQLFIEILQQHPSPFALDRLVKEHFILFQARGRATGRSGNMLITGYYEPLLEGSLTRRPPYLYPLYAPPKSLLHRPDPRTGKKGVYRLDANNRLVPYWTRAEFEQANHGKGYELVYLKDPVDAFILHVQGSGKIQLTDGTTRALHFAASNGRPYSSIGKLLVDEKKLTLQQASLPAIRAYLRAHPEEQQRILYHNERYIFFGWGTSKEPKGSLGLPLTPGRSVAIDHATLPAAVPGYLISRKPQLNDDKTIGHWMPLQRFVVAQDAGSAIKGSGRLDMFWGNGAYAQTAAGAMRERGQLYFLMAKSAAGPTPLPPTP